MVGKYIAKLEKTLRQQALTLPAEIYGIEIEIKSHLEHEESEMDVTEDYDFESGRFFRLVVYRKKGE